MNNEYFEWLFDLVCDGRFSPHISYRRLLKHLHNTEFIFDHPMDDNRAADGLSLRYRYSLNMGVEEPDEGPCSFLEMLIALALRCEETIMDDPSIGNRTGQWFWEMITNLELGAMVDDRFDAGYVDYILDGFFNKEYEPDGKGGLFTIRNCEEDVRTFDIWRQLCYYLDSIV